MNSYTLDKLDEHKPLRDEVFLSLRKAILNGRFVPGERLVEKDLAQQLAISRTPIREALRKLELEGLVAYEPRRGVIVVGISLKDALEIYTIRAVLEGLAANLAASRRTQEELTQLREFLTTMETCIQQNNIHDLIAAHLSFHKSFAVASKSPRLCQMIASLRDYVKSFEETFYYLPYRLQSGWEEHKSIVDTIEKKDNEQAEYAARNHVMQAKESFLKAISEEKERFKRGDDFSE